MALLTGINLVKDEPINDLVGFLLKTPMGNTVSIDALQWCKDELLRQFRAVGNSATLEVIRQFTEALDQFKDEDDRATYCRGWLSEIEKHFPSGMNIVEPPDNYLGRRRPAPGHSFIIEGGKIGYIS